MNVKLIPPVSAQREEIGRENNTNIIRMDTDAESLPIIISEGVIRVVNREAKVLFSFSNVIDDAENAGTSSRRSVRFILKKRANIFLPLAEATECMPPPGHKSIRTELRVRR
jgi:hypothetical protein